MRQSIRFVLTLVLCPVLSLSSLHVGVPPARAADTGTWTPTGVTGQYVCCLVIDPLAPAVLYAGSDGGGVFRSTDRGSHWTAANTGLIAVNTPHGNYHVCSLAIDPLTPTTLYAGTEDRGVFRSTDRGSHWTAANTGLAREWICALAIDPLTPATLYAVASPQDLASRGGVFRSTDNGDHWTRVTARIKGSLVIDPLTPATLYASAGYGGFGVFRSMDGGATWNERGRETDLHGYEVLSLAIDPLTPSTLYAGTHRDGVFRSTDSGATWSATNTGLPQLSIQCLAVDSRTPATLYAGIYYGGVFRSTDSGSHWTALNTGLADRRVLSLAINPVTPSILYAGTFDGGVFRYDATMGIIELEIGSSTMLVDGRPVVLEAAPIILNSRTLLPIRAVVEAVGGTIAWEASTRKVTIVRKDKKLELWISNSVARLNGQSIKIDSDAKVVPIIMNGRTLLPLRFVAEALALDVQWDAATQTITITDTP